MKDNILFYLFTDVWDGIKNFRYQFFISFMAGVIVGLFCAHLVYSDLVDELMDARKKALPAASFYPLSFKYSTSKGDYVSEIFYDSVAGEYKVRDRLLKSWEVDW